MRARPAESLAENAAGGPYPHMPTSVNTIIDEACSIFALTFFFFSVEPDSTLADDALFLLAVLLNVVVLEPRPGAHACCEYLTIHTNSDSTCMATEVAILIVT